MRFTGLYLTALTACGGAGPQTSAPSLPEPVDSPVTPVAQPAEPSAPPLEPPAEGTQLAAGRLGCVLDGLSEGGWKMPGEHGMAESGPDVPSDHVLTRTTEQGAYELHIVASESFRPVRDAADLGQSALRGAGDGATVFESNAELGVAGVLDPFAASTIRTSPEDWMRSKGYIFLAQLTVAVRGGTYVNIALSCAGGAACRSDDRQRLAQEVAASLRRGPRLRGGGTWDLRLPNGDSDKRVRVSLPDGVVGLGPRASFAGIAWPAILLSTGREAMKISIGTRGDDTTPTFEPGAGVVPDPLPGVVPIQCAPFRCDAVFSRDPSARSSLITAWAGARVDLVSAEPQPIPLGGGRLHVLLGAPGIEARRDDDGDTIETTVRYGDRRVRLRVRDTLRPAAEALGPEGFFAEQGLLAEDGSNVEQVESTDAALSVTRVLRLSGQVSYSEVVPAHLVVGEREGTAMIVELVCDRRAADCIESAPALSAELARRFRRGTPLETASTLRVTLAGRNIEVDLPEGYVMSSDWNDPNHGGWGVSASHTRGAPAILEFEDSGGAQGASIENTGRRTGRRTRLRLGSEVFAMRERRRTYDDSLIWGADLGCGGGACVVLIRTRDVAERDRLIAALAAARVTRVPPPTPCMRGIVEDENDGTLNLRARPTTRAPLIRALDEGTEVVIEETRGQWARLAAPHAGWVWNASVYRTCE